MELTLDRTDRLLIEALADGLPLDQQPYARLGETVGLTEREVLARLERLIDVGIIRRFGVVVRHHELGYRANAMVVWDVPDAEVAEVGRRLAASPVVTLCYRRPRRRPQWPYNLFCMIHGRDRAEVERQIADLKAETGIADLPSTTLFSRRRFKQRGAAYLGAAGRAERVA